MASISDKEKIRNILSMNSNKPFVDRILYKEDYPVLDNRTGETRRWGEVDENISTHSMADAEIDGRNIVYPTVVFDHGRMIRLEDDEALMNALKTGDFIEFKSPKEANWFARNYKKAWDK